MRKLALIGAVLVAFNTPAYAAQTVYDINNGVIADTENICVAITVVFTTRDCSYGDTREFQTGIFSPDWLGPTGGSPYYAQGGPEELPTYVPTPTDNRIDIPVTGTWTIDDMNTPDPSDDEMSATFVLGQVLRHVSTGASTRAVERWDSITHTLAPTAVNAANDLGGGSTEYIIAINGVFPTRMCEMGNPTNCFPVRDALEANPPGTFFFWDAPSPVGIGRANIWAPGQSTVPPPGPPLPPGPAFGAAVTTAVFANYSCDDIGNGDCPTNDATAGQQIDGNVLVWGGLETPGYDNFIVRIVTDGAGAITTAEAYVVQENFINQGINDGTDNGWQASRLTFTGQAQINFDAVDDPNETAAEGVATPLNVLANDIGLTDPVTVTIAQAPGDGVAVVNGSPGDPAAITITYTSGSPLMGGATDTFQYTVDDGVNPPDTATVTVTRQGSGANADTATTRLNTAITIDALANDSGFVDPVTVTITANPDQGGTATPNGSPGNQAAVDIGYIPVAALGTPTYTETFTYQITDGILTETADVVVTVNNAVPAAAAGAATTDEGVPVDTDVAGLGGVSLGDAPSTISVSAAPANGSTSVAGNVVTYTPTGFFAGMDSYDYTITDDDGETAVGTVTVTVTGVVPTAMDDAATVDQNDMVTIDVAANDTLGSGALVDHTVTVTGAPASGATTVAGTNVTYTPDAGFNGMDQFDYDLEDANGDTSTATVVITVDASGIVAKLPGNGNAIDPWSLLMLLLGAPMLRRKIASA